MSGQHLPGAASICQGTWFWASWTRNLGDPHGLAIASSRVYHTPEKAFPTRAKKNTEVLNARWCMAGNSKLTFARNSRQHAKRHSYCANLNVVQSLNQCPISSRVRTLKIASSCSSSTLVGKRGLPIISSAKMQPTPQQSTLGPYRVAPSSSSGGRYHKVMTRLVRSADWSLSRRARPKSASWM